MEIEYMDEKQFWRWRKRSDICIYPAYDWSSKRQSVMVTRAIEPATTLLIIQ